MLNISVTQEAVITLFTVKILSGTIADEAA